MRIRLCYITSIVFTLILLSGCKQFEYEPYFELPPPPLENITAYSYFKTGTYWIYKDSASSVEDSVYVFYDTAFQYHLGPGNWQKEGDYMQYEFHSHNYTDAYNYDYVIDMGYYGKKGIVGPQRKKFKPGDYVGTSFMMSNIFDESCFLTYFGSPGTIYFRHFYDSLDVNGQMFYDVAHFQDTQNASENIYVAWYGSLNPQTDYFIAKNIGLIKIKITDQTQNNLINKSQSIIRYQIVQ